MFIVQIGHPEYNSCLGDTLMGKDQATVERYLLEEDHGWWYKDEGEGPSDGETVWEYLDKQGYRFHTINTNDHQTDLDAGDVVLSS